MIRGIWKAILIFSMSFGAPKDSELSIRSFTPSHSDCRVEGNKSLQPPRQNLVRRTLRGLKKTLPFALQSIFSTLPIFQYPPWHTDDTPPTSTVPVDFLTKPFDDKQFLQAIKRAIEKDRQASLEDDQRLDIRTRLGLLTPRENEIFHYVISGMMNKQIALKLGIAEKTVKVHGGRIMEKLWVDLVVELVRVAQKASLEPSEG